LLIRAEITEIIEIAMSGLTSVGETRSRAAIAEIKVHLINGTALSKHYELQVRAPSLNVYVGHCIGVIAVYESNAK
jgi:hypothetical protein